MLQIELTNTVGVRKPTEHAIYGHMGGIRIRPIQLALFLMITYLGIFNVKHSLLIKSSYLSI